MNNSESKEKIFTNESESSSLASNILSVVLIALIVLRVVIRIPIPFIDTKFAIFLAVMPLLFLYYVVKNRFYIKTLTRLKFEKENVLNWIPIFGLFWLLYGCIQLLLFNNLNTSGIKELIYIALGFMSIVCIFELMKSKSTFKYMLNTLLVIYSVIVIFSIFELLAGIHLSYSMLRDPENVFYGIDRIYFMATGVFYNPNDLSTFLAFFLPVLFFSKDYCIWKKIGTHIIMYLSVLVIICNDSWIVMISLIIAGIFAFVVIRPKIINSILYSVGFALLWAFGPKVMAVINPNAIILSLEDFLIREQIGGGSLVIRLNTYLYGIKTTFTESFGLGLGPSGFQTVKDIYKDKVMGNPHSLVIEIISQYGVIIFALFAFFYLYILVNLIKLYKAEKNPSYAMVIMILVIYPMATFSPSAYLSVTFQWIPVAWGIYFVWNKKQIAGKKESLEEKRT